MAHETLLYGFIAGAGRRETHDFRNRNEQLLATLPETDTFPYLTRSMFSCGGVHPGQELFRTPIIHFGASMNGLCFDEVSKWITKFEELLSRLYWHEACAHLWTDYIDGCYQYWWRWDDHAKIVAAYNTPNPLPTSTWLRHMKQVKRNLNTPPGDSEA